MMTQDERILLLIASLEQHGKVTTDEICERFSISKDSARRDLLRVVQTPGIQRIRGGAIKAPVEIQALSYHQKNTDNPSKIAIAGLAAELATTNDFLMLDTGTSISHLALQLKGPLTVISNSLDCGNVLVDKANIQFHMIGGQFDPFFRAIVGTKAIKQIEQYRVNKAFIGVCSLNQYGLFAASEEEAQIKQTMIKQAEYSVLLCEHKKFDKQHCFHVCDLKQINAIVTDRKPKPSLYKQLKAANIDLHIT